MRRDAFFNIELATRYGIDTAVITHHIAYWCFKNKAENRNYEANTYWTYNSVQGLQKMLPFWSNDQLRRRIEKTVESGVLIRGNFNSKGYDRTTWYSLAPLIWQFYEMDSATLPDAFSNNAKSNMQNSQMEVAELPNLYQGEHKENPKRTPRFVEPTLEEVVLEFESKGVKPAGDIAAKFVNFYTSNGWKVGKNKMKSWPHAVNTWIQRNKTDGRNNTGRGFKAENFNANELSDFIAQG